jgi:DNA-binding transcriptional LysR family regulator
MPRTDFNNLQAFILVARERSFTRAAAQLGVSQSALSHAMRALEAKLGVRLLARTTPAVPRDLTHHDCIGMRLPTHGGLYAWEFVNGGAEVAVQVEGQFIFNTTPQMLQAALDGHGLAYVPDDLAEAHVAAGRLRRVLQDWCPRFPGYHLYYPSRRQASPAFALVLTALRQG